MKLPWLEAPRPLTPARVPLHFTLGSVQNVVTPLVGARSSCALLYFHHQGQDHWTTMRLFVKELAKRMLDLVFDK